MTSAKNKVPTEALIPSEDQDQVDASRANLIQEAREIYSKLVNRCPNIKNSDGAYFYANQSLKTAIGEDSVAISGAEEIALTEEVMSVNG